MSAPTQALLVSTLAGLAAVTALTMTAGAPPWLWPTWAVLAGATLVAAVADRRRN
ncbi:hypothetical protein ACFWSJ_18955 [Streptomyces niveus]|uniref:hypothetical protein n=1 Tax=Streptomyces niveus TaxID=193462 RepID=UPI00365A68CD